MKELSYAVIISVQTVKDKSPRREVCKRVNVFQVFTIHVHSAGGEDGT